MEVVEVRKVTRGGGERKGEVGKTKPEIIFKGACPPATPHNRPGTPQASLAHKRRDPSATSLPINPRAMPAPTRACPGLHQAHNEPHHLQIFFTQTWGALCTPAWVTTLPGTQTKHLPEFRFFGAGSSAWGRRPAGFEHLLNAH